VAGVVVRVRFGSRRQLKQAFQSDLSRGQLFLRTDTPLAIGAMVPMVLELHDGQALDVRGEVIAVRTPAQASHSHPAGVMTRLVDFGADKRARVEDLLRRGRTHVPGVGGSGLIRRVASADALLPLLRRVLFLCGDAAALSEADYYQVLGLPSGAGPVEVRDACGALRALVDPASPPEGLALTAEQQERLARLYALVVQIERTLTDPTLRAEYDSVRFGILR
jgi:Tfp pilus assembly protein PilZ